MKNTQIAMSIVFMVGLTGCAPQTPYERFKAGAPLENYPYKTGATYSSINRDITSCQVRSVQQVPQQQVVRTTPTYTTPVQTYCNRIGTQTICNSTGGQTYGGQTYSVDANAELRQRVFAQCMIDIGYRYVNLPPCPQNAVFKASAGLPPLSLKTCYRVTPDGTTLIGNY